MLKVVIDTNVFLSAFLFGGKPGKVLLLARREKIEVVISEVIIEEISRILKVKFSIDDWRIARIIEEINDVSRVVVPVEQCNGVVGKDRHILECAAAAKADYIVSGDKKHILPLKEFRGIKIVSPAEFLKIL